MLSWDAKQPGRVRTQPRMYIRKYINCSFIYNNNKKLSELWFMQINTQTIKMMYIKNFNDKIKCL